MKYIKSIEIVNFQSHKYSKLEFEEGYNVICGPSDSGKSAIIRALRWVLYNEPKGTEFITFGENTCKVSITFNDGITIVRERSKNRNIYRLIDSQGVETIFEGFGNDIPKEILTAHGINKIYIDIDSPESINLASQLEGPFLLDKSGSTKSKAIGKLVGVHIIDEALKELNKDLLNIQSDVRKLNNDYENINNDLKQYDNLESLRERLESSEEKIEELKYKYKKLENLKNIKTKLINIDNEISLNRKIIESIGDMDYIQNIADLVQLKLVLKDKFVNIKNRLIKIKEDIKYQNIILAATKHIDDCNIDLIEAANNYNKMNILKKLNTQYKLLINEINQYNNMLLKLKNIEDTKDLLLKYEYKYSSYSKLLDVKIRLNNVNNSLNIGYKYISKLEKIEIANSMFNKVKDINEKTINLNTIKCNLLKINNEITSLKREINECNNTVSVYIKEYAKVLKELGKCPLCLSHIDEHTTERIINEL